MILKVLDDTKGHGTCRSCEAPIVWFELTSGKKHPFDGDPVYVLTEHEKSTRRLIGHVDTSVTPSHFATCPDAAKFRRRKT
jgi:hypothetical protein